MSYSTILKIIPFLEEKSIDLGKLSKESNLNKSLILEALKPLIEDGYITEYGEEIRVAEEASLYASTLALKLGASLKDLCTVIGWRNFENFVEKILLEYGYRTFRGFRLKKPRLEVDVLALKEGFGLAVDCKHWHKTLSSSTLNSIALKQVERAKTILSKERSLLGGRCLVPVIVILYPSPIKFLDGVPIVPVEMFKSFVSEIDGRLSEVLKVYLEGDEVYAKI